LAFDYDECANLSTSREDLANTDSETDSEQSMQHPGIELYQYETYLRETSEDQVSEGDSSLSNEDEEGSAVHPNCSQAIEWNHSIRFLTQHQCPSCSVSCTCHARLNMDISPQLLINASKILPGQCTD